MSLEGNKQEENRLPDSSHIELTVKNETYTSVEQNESSKKSRKSSKKVIQMLTSGQLSDLFRRLDTSGTLLLSSLLLLSSSSLLLLLSSSPLLLLLSPSSLLFQVMVNLTLKSFKILQRSSSSQICQKDLLQMCSINLIRQSREL